MAPSAVKAQATFAYTAKLQPCIDELASPPRGCPAGDWDSGFSTDAAGFRAFVTFPDRLAPGKSFAIRVPMSTPVTLNSPPDAMPIAWNSFAHTDFVLRPGAAVPTQLPVVEPPKVGVALPFGTLEVDKQVTGPEAATATGPFGVHYDCTVTPAGGTPQSVAAGDASFGVDTPLLVPSVPVGATCSVWETDARGGISDHTSAATAVTTVIKDQSNGNTTVTLVNDFPTPPSPPSPPPPSSAADLSVTKEVNLAHARVGQSLTYTIGVTNHGPATGTDVRVSDSASQRLALGKVTPSQGSCAAGQAVQCALGSLVAGAHATITIQASASAPGVLRNTATVSADQPDSTPADNTASAEVKLSYPPARLRVTKTPRFVRALARSRLTYRIRVQALGSAPAFGVRVCDSLGRSLTVVSAPHARVRAGRPCWTIARLGPLQPRLFTVKVAIANVASSVDAGDVASASAINARAVRARARVALRSRPTPPPFTG